MTEGRKPRVLVFIVAYNAEKTIREVVFRIPAGLLSTYDVDVLIIDDSSRDATFEKGHSISKDPALPFPITVLFNPRNQGYGGNQKLGYHYALQENYDFVALDSRRRPVCAGTPARNFWNRYAREEAAAVFGSRMLDALPARARARMPLYKFVGKSRILTWIRKQTSPHEPERIPFRIPHLLDPCARKPFPLTAIRTTSISIRKSSFSCWSQACLLKNCPSPLTTATRSVTSTESNTRST